MLIAYPAMFLKEKQSTAYCVKFPDLPEGSTCGATVEEALTNAQEVLKPLLYEPFLAKALPSASALLDVKLVNDDASSYDLAASFVSLVGVDMERYTREIDKRTIRKNVTIPTWINTKAESVGINFSQVLTEALRERLEL